MQIIVWLSMAAACAVIALVKGRNAIAWFFIGLLLNLVAVVIVAVLPNLKQQKADAENSQRERRRLREQIRQERIKSEAFRRYSMDRLDRHDDALNIDTRDAGGRGDECLGRAQDDPIERLIDSAGAADQAVSGPDTAGDGAQWFYEVDGRPWGPILGQELRRLLSSGRLSNQTLVWTEGLRGWRQVGQVSALRLDDEPGADEGGERH